MDGHSLAYRAFYALPVENFSTKDGQHTNGIYGFLAMLINLIKAERPTHLAVAFDTSRQSFRTRVYTEYKANRSETPAEFRGQIPILQDCLAAMSIPVLQKEDIEADDILATLATQGAEQGFSVLVCSGDRDTIQLVNDDITLLYPNVQGVSQLKRYDRAAVVERYGVQPEQYPDIAALVGETSDNLPGVPKVGEKTAVKWLGQFGTLDALLENADKVTGVVGGNLREHLDDVRRNRSLNRLLRDVELPLGPEDLEVQPMDAQAVRDIFARLEFKTLIPRVAELAGIEQQMAAVTSAAAVPMPVPVELAARRPPRVARRARDGGEVGVTVIAEGGLPRRIGFAKADAAAEADWTPEVSEALGRVAGVRRPQDLQRRQAAGQGAAPRGTARRRPRVRHHRRGMAAASELPRQDAGRPRRPLPRREAARGRSHAARARDGGRHPGPALVVRRPRDRRAARRASRRGRDGAHRHRAADAAGPRRHGARRRRRLARQARGVLGRPR